MFWAHGNPQHVTTTGGRIVPLRGCGFLKTPIP